MESRVHPLLQVSNLRTSFFTDKGEIKAVDDVSFSIRGGQTLALVGESGCGKSVAALSIMRLISSPGRVIGGTIQFKGQNLLDLSEKDMRRIRGKSIGMVFQEPMTSLNPVMSIGDQIGEVLKIHTTLSDRDIRKEVISLLEKVRISAPERRLDQYPHEMSGGMKQRVMIAMALACQPDLLIADEPTTALDVTIQAQILDLLSALQKDMGMAILLITHNLGVVAQFAQDVIVMYASKIAERATVKELFRNPSHPYTSALLKSLPRPGERQARLEAIPGTVPSPLQYPVGCHFSSRCPEVMDHCPLQPPPTVQVGESHETVCWLYDKKEP
ncbi:ABC transporter ATP-binding protein [Candidatus Nitrospira allomarina]|uniref:ABC transporter ATP-binding protein n=1 Tax=Candidatus Nitrospira allomarina TaxID=3020900 RepID=A0AA96G820_9BACT|nr:ABC transporter ATP-binding protein [Candidatus Nitrospira allomarina]WNM56447.1 ABC transporter ATP-binding protein [Candidatus Nitrospira allomarina]